MPISIAGSGAVTGASTLNGLSVPADAIAPALVLINKTDFSSVSTVSINNCFTSTYQNYKIIIDFANASADIGVNFRLRASGTDSSTGYYTASNYVTPGAAFLNWSGGTNQAQVFMGYVRDAGKPFHSYEIFSPALARETNAQMLVTDYDNGGLVGTIMWATHSVSSVFDGITIFPNSSTITGTIRIYGYRNA